LPELQIVLSKVVVCVYARLRMLEKGDSFSR